MTAHPGPIVASRAGLSVVDCSRCGYAHLTEIPDPAALSRYYSSDFWQKEKAGWLARYEAQADWDAARWGDWLEFMEVQLSDDHDFWQGGPANLLDVGAGYGGFVKAATESGWAALGWEPSQSAADYARQNNSRVVNMGWTPDAECGFQSAISALWLVEHLPDPMAFLLWCHQHLELGGLLLAAVPNEFSLRQLHANAKAKTHDYFVHHTHINYFSVSSFSNLLGRAGFTIIDRLATYPMEYFVTAGLDYTDSPAIGDRCHTSVRMRDLRRTRASRIAFYRELAAVGQGRDQIVIARAE